MNSTLSPYISFRDNCREAMEYYRSIFGGKVELHTFKEFNASQDSSEDDFIMHSMLTADNGIVFMASDSPKRMEYKPGNTISMSISGTNSEELTGYFDKLNAGGKIIMPLEKAVWGDTFGMCIDKFGIQWLINIFSKEPGEATS